MAKKQETVFKEKCQKDLKALSLKYQNTLYFTKIQQVALRGTPDLLLCVAGLFIAIELKKSEREKPDPLQNRELQKIKAARGYTFVACPENWQGVLNILERLLKGSFVADKSSSLKK